MLHICILACKAMSWCLFFKMWRSHSAKLFAFDLKKFCEGDEPRESSRLLRHGTQGEVSSTSKVNSINAVCETHRATLELCVPGKHNLADALCLDL